MYVTNKDKKRFGKDMNTRLGFGALIVYGMIDDQQPWEDNTCGTELTTTFKFQPEGLKLEYGDNLSRKP